MSRAAKTSPPGGTMGTSASWSQTLARCSAMGRELLPDWVEEYYSHVREQLIVAAVDDDFVKFREGSSSGAVVALLEPGSASSGALSRIIILQNPYEAKWHRASWHCVNESLHLGRRVDGPRTRLCQSDAGAAAVAATAAGGGAGAGRHSSRRTSGSRRPRARLCQFDAAPKTVGTRVN